MPVRKILQGGCHATVVMRNARQRQPHLNTAQSCGQHQFIKISQVPDAEHAAGEFAQARPQREIEPFEHQLAQVLGRVLYRLASTARFPMALKLKPGGSLSPFCDPLTVTSTLHSSCR